ncbi:hypothetical protein [Streptomyces sp. JJ36]|uniref:hypothetical protein n=1 Tax=Streptomyces sp. JJ36 TaxID=2736645 RepID=UPI001F3A529A|nr:hypothetical protein [Streptomyces sp. JJ36]MCF6521654.1 hypothetical protein [Streptomyces sp. JJ36]
MRESGRTGVAVAVVLAVAATVAGCGKQGADDLVVTGEAPARPYGGPLWVPSVDAEGDGAEGVRAEAGAAGRALECDGPVRSGGRSGPWSEGDGGETPEEGLRAYFEIEQPGVPERGYRVERREAGRVLFSYDVAGETKVAVVVAEDRPRRPGWGPETAASCDPAEFAPEYAEEQGWEVWTDRRGERVPLSEVSSSAGSGHCGWEQAHFLELGAGADRKLYARDPEGVLPPDMLTVPYDGSVRLPAAARDTGYRLDDRQLWLVDGAQRAYVRTPDGTEAWPAVREGMSCA